MKTFNNLYNRIATFEALMHAWPKVSKGRKYHLAIMKFRQGLESNLLEIERQLQDKTFATGPYRHFKVYEPKERDIAALPVKDRIVQHALFNVLEPIWEARFIADSYACRINKGTHAAHAKAVKYLRAVKRKHGHVYALKADIAKYFFSVDHAILKALVRKHVVCKDTLWLVDSIIDSAAEINGCAKGIPIGNLTSQLFANIYLHELDKFVKYSLREKHYMRYMDDFVVLHNDKQHLHEIRRQIEAFLANKLKLACNNKTQVFEISNDGRCLDFVGFRTWTTHSLIRKDSIKRMRRKMTVLSKHYNKGIATWSDVEQTVNSWIAHCYHANTYNLRKSVLEPVVFTVPAKET